MNTEEMVAAIHEAGQKPGGEGHEMLAAVLDEQEEFRDRRLMINTAGQHSAFDGLILATLILRRMGQTRDAAEVVRWLEKVLATKEARALCVLPLWGVVPDASIALTDEIRLLPFGDLPPHPQGLSFREVRESGRPPFATQSTWQRDPPAALVSRFLLRPIVFQTGGPEEPDLLTAYPLREELDEVRLVIALIGPCTPMPDLCWIQFEDEDLQAAVPGTGYQFEHIEIVPQRLEQYGEFDGEAAQVIVQQYLALDQKPRKKVRLALDRLHRAMRRRHPGDKAIELAIAFEALLTGYEGEPFGEQTFKIGLRTGLLAGEDLETRAKSRKIAKAIYALRSSMIHTGEAL